MKTDDMRRPCSSAPLPLLFLIVSALAISAGCMDARQPARKIDIYTPIYAPPTATNLTPLPVIVGVDRFSVAPELNTSRMAYQEAPNRLGYYNYNQWQANPADIVTYFTARDLRATGRFSGVIVPGSSVQPSHRIEGVVDSFQEVDDGDGRWFSELVVSISLVRAREPDVSRRILFQKTYQHREPVTERSPKGVAAGMSRCLSVISDLIARDVYDRLSRPGA